MSTTTISLPRPFILTKGWLASALMGGPLLPLYLGKLAGRGKLKCLAALAAREAFTSSERPISLTVSAPAAISIPARRLGPTCVFKGRLGLGDAGALALPIPVSGRLAPA